MFYVDFGASYEFLNCSGNGFEMSFLWCISVPNPTRPMMMLALTCSVSDSNILPTLTTLCSCSSHVYSVSPFALGSSYRSENAASTMPTLERTKCLKYSSFDSNTSLLMIECSVRQHEKCAASGGSTCNRMLWSTSRGKLSRLIAIAACQPMFEGQQSIDSSFCILLSLRLSMARNIKWWRRGKSVPRRTSPSVDNINDIAVADKKLRSAVNPTLVFPSSVSSRTSALRLHFLTSVFTSVSVSFKALGTMCGARSVVQAYKAVLQLKRGFTFFTLAHEV